MTWTDQKYIGMGWYVSINNETYEEDWKTIASYQNDFKQTVAKTPEEFLERKKVLRIE